MAIIKEYPKHTYDFEYLMKQTMQYSGSLPDIHLRNTKCLEIDLLRRETDQSTIYHKLFYLNFKNYIEPTFLDFIKTFIKPIFCVKDEKLIYQTTPTFRIHLPNNLGVGEFHKDKDYNHGINEKNIWLPFTNTFDTNTIWVESEEDKGDYKPYNLKYGEFLIFDGSNLKHGNKINNTGKTRISIDFRVMNEKDFIPSDKGSINTNKIFDLGGYFSIL